MLPVTLGIDTSGREGSVALMSGGRLLGERPLEPRGRRHAQTLTSEVHDLFSECGVAADNCELIAVSIGPGSFTGLRVGVVFAKTFAWATGCRVIAVDTLAAIAENTPAPAESVFVVSDAQRGDLYVNEYSRSADGWATSQEIEIVSGESWCNDRSPADVVTGPGVNRFESFLTGRCHVVEPLLRSPRASVVAQIGQRSVLQGPSDDPWTLEPLYIRRSSAEDKWEERQAGTTTK